MGSLAIVQTGATASGPFSAANTLISSTMSSTPTAGNLLLTFGIAYRATTYNVTGYAGSGFNGSEAQIAYGWKFAGVGESTTQTAAQTNSATAMYCESICFEISGCNAIGTPTGTPTTGNLTASGQTYTAPAVTVASNGSVTNAVFHVFGFTDYNGITGASVGSPFTLVGPYQANNGSSNTDTALNIYIAYQLNVAGGTYQPVLTITGTPHGVTPPSMSIAVNNSAASGATADFLLLDLIR